MTPDQLEREILDIIRKADKYGYLLPSEEDYFVKEALELFRKELREVAEKAFEAGYSRCGWEEGFIKDRDYPDQDGWLKENNL